MDQRRARLKQGAARRRSVASFERLEERRLLSGYGDGEALLAGVTLPEFAQAGSAIATSGTKVAIGAPFDGAGVVYVVDTSTNTVESISAPAGVSRFGSAVTFVGDTLAVSAPDTAQVGEGTVLLFARGSEGWEATGEISGADVTPTDTDFFGAALAAYGTDKLLISVLTDRADGEDDGAVLMFDVATGTGLGRFDSPSGADDRFGSAIAVSGDFLVVAAQNVESVYLYDLTAPDAFATSLPEGHVPKAPAATYLAGDATGALFGLSVAISGTRVAVGAPGESAAGVGGAVLLFDRDAGGEAIATLANPAEFPFANFGLTLAFNADGTELAVTAPLLGAGAAYVFDTDTLAEVDFIENPDPAPVLPLFGSAVAYGDDGLVIADPMSGASFEGQVWLFRPDAPPANEAPVLGEIVGPAEVLVGDVAEFSASFSDDDPAGTSVLWDFGDGATFAQVVDAAGTLSASHVYAAPGTYTVTLTVTDGQSATATKEFVVEVTAPVPVPAPDFVVNPALSTAVIVVTAAANGAVSISVNGVPTVVSGADPTAPIAIVGTPGNDIMVIAPTVRRSIIFYAGAGDDIITSGGGADAIFGGPGNDIIIGGGGRDMLVGGSGSDIIVGTGDEDILVGGTTAYDDPAGLADLRAILAFWAGPGTFAQRVAALRDGIGVPALEPEIVEPEETTVFDDAVTDLLVGGAGYDWFLYNRTPSDSTRDLALDLSSFEAQFAQDLSVL